MNKSVFSLHLMKSLSQLSTWQVSKMFCIFSRVLIKTPMSRSAWMSTLWNRQIIPAMLQNSNQEAPIDNLGLELQGYQQVGVSKMLRFVTSWNDYMWNKIMLSLEETGLDSRRSSSIIVTLHDQVVAVQWFERGRRFNLFRGISISRFKVQETSREPVQLKMFFISTLA